MKVRRLAWLGVSLWFAVHAGATFGRDNSPGRWVIPFELEDKRIWLPVRVNGAGPASFLFDSAAGGSSVCKQAAARFGIQPTAEADTHGAGDGTQRVSVAQDLKFSISGLEYQAGQVPLIDFDSVASSLGRRFDGLIGGDFLAKYVVEFDYETQQMIVYEPGAFKADGKGEEFPMKRACGGPVIPGAVHMPGRDLPLDLLIDAPYAGALEITSPFVDKHQLLESARQVTPNLIESAIHGVGGTSGELIGRVSALQIGSFSFRLPVTSFSRAKGGTLASPEIGGVIGGEILRRFRVIYDYPGKRVILKPNRAISEPFVYDMSGLRLKATSAELKEFQVVGVAAGSPAGEAALLKGDTLINVNGRPAAEFRLQAIRDLLKQPGNVVRLRISRGGELKDVSLTLRPLI